MLMRARLLLLQGRQICQIWQAISEEAFWHSGDATRPRYNDYSSEGRAATVAATATAAGAVAEANDEHPGW